MLQSPLLDVLECVERRNAIPEHFESTKRKENLSLIECAYKDVKDPSRAFFRLTGFVRSEFDMLLRLLPDDSLPHRGKAKAINTLEEQLFLLLNVLHHGSCTLTNILASKKLHSQSATVRLLHSIVSRLRAPLADLFLSFRKDRIESMKDVGIVLDCTVIPTNRPGGRLEYGKKFFSGKHHIYCVKAEVGVNPKVGRASTISAIYSGSTHDYVIFKEHYPLFESKLEGSKIQVDSAYIGARPDLDVIITKPVGTQELASHRVIVERFFGRMKTLFSIFRKPWIFETDRIADYFNVACCLTNFHILHNPLTAIDSQANSRFLDGMISDYLRKQEAKSLANERYLARLRNKLNPKDSLTPTITSLTAESTSFLNT
ncbi:putative DDE superfamily endonuclease [Monocercomonoides exilis]|uniref:putative DDE superfamily endonuclease n=1 Tax=Monocercomonoides exilis TaxID=2049356 RepID=UPI003559FE27|nr:putative DDE superfamily endonuclease [Monocercomonoides exilis]|eukprot:MONOS_5270.1-p1 / transcript=MONOS_5270.1 / gene=MONOS_5270 / organism=Monocercomonoides_exilis_PA203 / gene_product=unspecified product / transcript_product=unspecified product / location=Mono_scaffold00151:84512-85630(-) / protein_length=372 / sequence_SO=supercontig / SO=protein_coding / is_pseudo=false